MAEQESKLPASLPQASEQQGESARSGDARPIRLLDPIDLWYRPQVLLSGIGRGLTSPDRGRTRYGPPASWSPVVEIVRNDQNLLITAELPGLSMEDIKVEIIGNVLVLQGERRRDRASGHVIRRTERRYGHFYREIVLPDGVDVEHVRAEIENGILRVTLPLATHRRAMPIQSTEQPTSEAVRNKKEAA
jgi:HSP20 family molecular chaperone IbpA